MAAGYRRLKPHSGTRWASVQSRKQGHGRMQQSSSYAQAKAWPKSCFWTSSRTLSLRVRIQPPARSKGWGSCPLLAGVVSHFQQRSGKAPCSPLRLFRGQQLSRAWEGSSLSHPYLALLPGTEPGKTFYAQSTWGSSTERQPPLSAAGAQKAPLPLCHLGRSICCCSHVHVPSWIAAQKGRGDTAA